jgi:hypothetical protein
MLKRWLSGLTVVCVLAAAWPARAADAKQEQPTLVITVKSLDSLIANTKYLIKVAGYEEQAKQYEAMLKARIGKKGLDGIDTKRPLGMYVTDFQNGSAVAMVPIADEKALLNFLKGLNLDPEKNDKGLYTVSPDFLPIEFYFRIVNKYAYVTALNSENIDPAKLLDPAVIAPRNKNALASITAHISRIPDTLKQLALSQLELQLKNLQKARSKHETEAQAKIHAKVLKELTDVAAAVIKEGDEVAFHVEVDRKANTVAVEASLNGKPNTRLSKMIAQLAGANSLFADIAGEDDAATARVHVSLPESLREAIGPLVDEGLKKLHEKEKDEAKRELGEKFLKAVIPTLKAGEIDVLAALRGPTKNGHYAGLVGIKIKDGNEVEKVVKEIITKVAPMTEKVKIKLDAAKEGDVAIHQVTLTADIDAKVKAILGNEPLYFAFRKDAVLVAVGEGGLDALKAAIAAQPKAGPLVTAQVSLARLVPLITAASKNDKHGEEVAKVLKAALEDAKDPGKVQLTIEGGESLKARLSLSAQVIKVIAAGVSHGVRREVEQQKQKAEDKDK